MVVTHDLAAIAFLVENGEVEADGVLAHAQAECDRLHERQHHDNPQNPAKNMCNKPKLSPRHSKF